MIFSIKPFHVDYLNSIQGIWNDVIKAGCYFPQVETLTLEECQSFFSETSFTGVALMNKEVVGVYVLQTNNVGRLGKVANASYAVKGNVRGNKVGEKLIKHSLKKAKELNYRILQFNSVVESNNGAKYLYEKMGFKNIGLIPNCFEISPANFQGVRIYYYDLTKIT